MIADDQHAQFAQHQDADHVDDVDFGAKGAEVEDALLGDDGADQERDQNNDRHRAPADALEVMNGRGEAQPRRARDRAARSPSSARRRAGRAARATRRYRPRPPDRIEHRRARDCRRGARRAGVRLTQPHLLDEAAVGVGEADEARGRAARGERARRGARSARRRTCRAVRAWRDRCRSCGRPGSGARSRRRVDSSAAAASAVQAPVAARATRSPSTRPVIAAALKARRSSEPRRRRRPLSPPDVARS